VGFGSLKRIEGMEIVIAYKNDLPQVFFKDDCMKRDRSNPLLFDKGRVCSPLPYFTSFPDRETIGDNFCFFVK
jgi:hypothetical protein